MTDSSANAKAAEPSMEDILASIRRIIDEEDGEAHNSNATSDLQPQRLFGDGGSDDVPADSTTDFFVEARDRLDTSQEEARATVDRLAATDPTEDIVELYEKASESEASDASSVGSLFTIPPERGGASPQPPELQPTQLPNTDTYPDLTNAAEGVSGAAAAAHPTDAEPASYTGPQDALAEDDIYDLGTLDALDPAPMAEQLGDTADQLGDVVQSNFGTEFGSLPDAEVELPSAEVTLAEPDRGAVADASTAAFGETTSQEAAVASAVTAAMAAAGSTAAIAASSGETESLESAAFSAPADQESAAPDLASEAPQTIWNPADHDDASSAGALSTQASDFIATSEAPSADASYEAEFSSHASTAETAPEPHIEAEETSTEDWDRAHLASSIFSRGSVETVYVREETSGGALSGLAVEGPATETVAAVSASVTEGGQAESNFELPESVSETTTDTSLGQAAAFGAAALGSGAMLGGAFGRDDAEDNLTSLDTSEALSVADDSAVGLGDAYSASDVYSDEPPELESDYRTSFENQGADKDVLASALTEAQAPETGFESSGPQDDTPPTQTAPEGAPADGAEGYGQTAYRSDDPSALVSMTSEEMSARALASLHEPGQDVPGRIYGGLRVSNDPETETLEDMVRKMLKPMLKEWLDANLPNVVEGVVRGEVERIGARAARYQIENGDEQK